MLEHCGACSDALVEVTAFRLETVAISKHRHRILEATPKQLSNPRPLLYQTKGGATCMTPANGRTGRSENTADRLSSNSDATLTSFTITIVCPRTDTELIGPTDMSVLTSIEKWDWERTVEILVFRPVKPFELSGRREVQQISDNWLGFWPRRKREAVRLLHEHFEQENT